MEIQPNENGWSISAEDQNGLWHLVHNAIDVLLFIHSEGQTSTTERLFVGTQEECESEIKRLGLTWQPPEGTTAVLASEVDFESLPPKPEL